MNLVVVTKLVLSSRWIVLITKLLSLRLWCGVLQQCSCTVQRSAAVSSAGWRWLLAAVAVYCLARREPVLPTSCSSRLVLYSAQAVAGSGPDIAVQDT